MAKFTPGPWDWDQPSNWYGISARVMKREPYGMIAQVDISGWRPKSMAIANARLISAAPEMYAALEAIVGEAAFEGLPECKQEAIIAALSKAVT